MMRLDDREDEDHFKALIYGPPGTGKTGFGVSAPEPLILLSERQGMPHVRDAARRLGRPVPPVLFMQTLEDYRAVLRTLRAPKAADGSFKVVGKDGAELLSLPRWPKTIVIDSLTDACRLVDEEVKRDAPPSKASDGLEKVTERHWAALRDRCEKLIRAFRDAPAHVLFLAHLDDRMMGEGDEAQRWVGPTLMMRALPSFVIGCVNVAAITTRTLGKRVDVKEGEEQPDRPIEFGLVTVGPGFFQLKPYRPLRDKEIPDFTDWIRRVRQAELDSMAATIDSAATPQKAA